MVSERLAAIRRALTHPQFYDGDIGADIRWLLALVERKADDHQLMADHSEALKFVREMSIQPCPHWCARDCLACRAKAWLHEAGK